MKTDFTMTGAGRPALIRGSVIHQGRQVRLEAESRCGRRWRLRIIGNKGRVSEWRHPFDSVAEAIVAGLAALQSDMDEFCDGAENSGIPQPDPGAL